MSAPSVQVKIVTYCRRPDLLYGTLLTFRTLRIGFPTASVTVIDNASLPEVRDQIRLAVESVGAEFIQRESPVAHAALIEAEVCRATGPLVFVDPDVIFWKKCEDWNFGSALMAGRMIPLFQDPYANCLTQERIHTSFLWLPDPAKLRAHLAAICERHFDFYPFHPVMVPLDNRWVRWDSFAGATRVLKSHAHAFDDEQLNSYDHLFCGSHIDLVAPFLPERFRGTWTGIHQRVATGDLESARGLWLFQEEFFRAMRPAHDKEKNVK